METLKVFGVIPLNYFQIGMFILIVILLGTAFFLTLDRLLNIGKMKSFVKSKTKKLSENQLQRQKKYSKDTFNYQESKMDFIYKFDKKFSYSGIQRKIPALSSGLVIAIAATLASIVGSFTIAASGNAIRGIIFAGVTLFLVYLVIAIVAKINYMAVEKDLTEFLNQLKAYSASTDDLLTCFRAIAENMHEPLSTALNEFYIQVQTTGKKSEAFYDLMNKIEHPLFKQFIRNLEICSRHSADYGVVVDNCRKTLRNYLKSKRDIGAQNKSECIIMTILVIAFFFSVTILKVFTGYDIWYEVLHTSLGNLFLVFQIGCVVVFLWNILLSNER